MKLDKPITIYEGRGDDFVAYLRTLPDEEAVALAKHAVTRGLDKDRNARELFRARTFPEWLLEMDAKGFFGTPTTTKQVAAELDAYDRELYPERYEDEGDS